MARYKVSVSGGRTSAYMAMLFKKHMSKGHELKFVFTNTSKEEQDTLRFLHDVDQYFELNLVWLEADVRQGRVSTKHRVIDYASANREGEVFEDVVRKYGIPNQTFKLCTRELKTNPMDSYMESIGWEDYYSAVGIRKDETRRVSVNAVKTKIVYPLVDWWPTDKQDVLEYFAQFSWDLKIPEWLGNCVDCHKKSFNKLAKVLADRPNAFDHSLKLDAKYSSVGPNCVPGPRKRYRGYHNTEDLLRVIRGVPEQALNSVEDGGCSESCEIYETS